jgi:hypothetical protein
MNLFRSSPWWLIRPPRDGARLRRGRHSGTGCGKGFALPALEPQSRQDRRPEGSATKGGYDAWKHKLTAKLTFA